MQIEKHMMGDITVITLDGRLDSETAPQAQQDLAELVPEGGHALIDLSRMSYMSSAGLRVLLLAYRQAKHIGVRLALAAVPPDTHAVMAATGFLEFFIVVDSVADGVEALAA